MLVDLKNKNLRDKSNLPVSGVSKAYISTTPVIVMDEPPHIFIDSTVAAPCLDVQCLPMLLRHGENMEHLTEMYWIG